MALRILVVEDDAAQLARLLSELRILGHEALGASSAEEAIPLAREMSFDAVLTDNVLPGMTGLSSIAEFAKVCAAPVMVMTSDPSAEGEKDAALMGARCYLGKPLDLQRLQRELQDAEREKGSPRHPEEQR